MKTIIYFCSLFLLLLPVWLTQHFGRSFTFETILFHFFSGLTGIAGTEKRVIYSFVEVTLLTPLMILGTQGTITFWSHTRENTRPRKKAFLLLFVFLAILIVFWTNYFFILQLDKEQPHVKQKQLDFLAKTLLITFIIPLGIWLFDSFKRKSALLSRLLRNHSLTLPLFVFLASATFFGLSTRLDATIKSYLGKDQFSSLYVSPSVIPFKKPEVLKNLVLIYVESFEWNLENTSLFGENLLLPLKKLKGQEIRQFVAAPGTTWSIAGMVATQCALPLKPFYNNTLGSKSAFLPKATCLSDVLSRYGYDQTFFVGTDINFSGMKHFYLNHSYQNVWGRDELITLDKVAPTLLTGWGGGLHDDTLLDLALKKILESHRQKKPFNVTIMTTDSHNPDGFPSERCSDEERQSGFIGSFKCSSKWVAQFISKLESAGVFEDTLVVVVGDHPFMETQGQAQYFPSPRNIFFKSFDRTGATYQRSRMTPFDLAPTVLDHLGLLTETDDRFGLGISLFSKRPLKELDSFFSEVSRETILNQSRVYDAFWE